MRPQSPTVTERLQQRLDGQGNDERAETLDRMAGRVSLRRLVTAEGVAAVVAFTLGQTLQEVSGRSAASS
jgi:hypothetical protein